MKFVVMMSMLLSTTLAHAGTEENARVAELAQNSGEVQSIIRAFESNERALACEKINAGNTAYDSASAIATISLSCGQRTDNGRVAPDKFTLKIVGAVDEASVIVVAVKLTPVL